MTSTNAETPPEATTKRRKRWGLRLAVLVVLVVIANAAIYGYLKTRSVPYRVKRLEQEAQLDARLGRLDEASRALADALALAPDNATLAVELCRVLDRRGEGDEAERLLRRTLARAPRSVDAALALAGRLLSRGQVAEAAAITDPLLGSLRAEEDPSRRLAGLVLFARIAARRGDVERAKGLLDDAATGASRGPALIAKGEVLADARDVAGAERALREACAALPLDPVAALALARVLEGAGRRDDAVAELTAFLNGPSERRLDVVPSLTELLERSGRFAEAGALADDVAKRPDGLALAAYVRGAIALAQGDASTAETEFGRMAELLPRSPDARLLVARAALRRDAPERARSALEEALALSRGLPQAELGLLALDERAGDVAAVRARAERLLESPATRRRAYAKLLATYAREQDAQGALAKLADLRKRFPEDAGLRLGEAVFRLLAGDTEVGVAELAGIADREGDLGDALSLLLVAGEPGVDSLETLEMLARMAAADPRLARARPVLARLFARAGRPDLALAALDAALGESPDLAEARLLRAEIHLRSGDDARAAPDLERLRAAAPGDIRILAALGEIRLRAGDGAAAAKLFEEARALSPGRAAIVARLARAQSLAGDGDRALATFAAARKLDPHLGPAQEDGALYLARGELEPAIAALRRGFADTGDPRMNGALAAASAEKGDAVAAVDPLLAWRARAGGGRDGALLEAVVLALSGDRERASAHLDLMRAPKELRDAVLRLGPGAGKDARVALGLEVFALSVLGWTPEAEARIERVARDPGADVLLDTWALLSLDATGSRRYDLRATIARGLAGLAPSDPSAGLDLSAALDAAGDRAGALASLRALRERFPADASTALELGKLLDRSGDRAGALLQYARAAEAERPDPVALNNLACLLGDDPAKRTSAIEIARRARRLAPRSADFADTLGWLLFEDGQLEEAEEVLGGAVSGEPSAPTIRYHYALAREARGDLAQAARHLETALLSKETETFPEAADARRALERLREEIAFAEAPGKSTAAVPLSATAGTPAGELHTTTDAAGNLLIALAAAPRPLRLRVSCAKDARLVLLGGARSRKQWLVPAGVDRVIRRLAVPRDGATLALRSEPGTSIALTVSLAAEPVEHETEPNDEPALADTLPIGGSLCGTIDGPADRDCFRLAIPPGDRADLVLESRGRVDLAFEVLGERGGSPRLLKSAVVHGAREVTQRGLEGPKRGALVVRLAAASEHQRPPSGRALGEEPDYALKLTPPLLARTGDVEPNDRIEDASPIELGAPVRGSLGPLDPVDWYAVATSTSAVTIRLSLPGGTGTPLALELWERSPGGVLPLRRIVAQGDRLVVPRWAPPREGRLAIAVVGAGELHSRTDYELSVERAPPPDGSETEPNDRPALADSASLGVPFRGTLDVPGDRDWVRVPALEAGQVLSITMRAAPDFGPATLSVFSRPDRDPRLVASFDATGGALEVPALRLPDGPAAVVIAAPAGLAPGPYELVLAAAVPSSGLEVEPNDTAATAIDLAPGRREIGRISGRADRDVFRVSGRVPLTVRATGGAAIAVLVRSERTRTLRVEPGTSATIAAADLGGEKQVLVEVFAATDASGKTGPGGTYELLSEEGR